MLKKKNQTSSSIIAFTNEAKHEARLFSRPPLLQYSSKLPASQRKSELPNHTLFWQQEPQMGKNTLCMHCDVKRDIFWDQTKHTVVLFQAASPDAFTGISPDRTTLFAFPFGRDLGDTSASLSTCRTSSTRKDRF